MTHANVALRSPETSHQDMIVMPELDNVLNFRDVNRCCPKLRPGRLFRSGHTLFATDKDADLLLGQFGIRTVIDLRADGDAEVKSVIGVPDATNRFVARLEKVPLDAAASSRLRKPSVTNVPFGGARQLLSYICLNGTLIEIVLLFLYSLFCMKQRAIGVMSRVFARFGLTGLSCALVSCSGDLVAEVLKVVAVNSENGVLVHCSLGKDRTGVIIALILMILDFEEDEIVNDYEESGRAVTVETRKALLPKTLFDKDLFADADGKVIRNLVKFIDKRYGSLNNYLDSIGFDESYRKMMRTNLLKRKARQ